MLSTLKITDQVKFMLRCVSLPLLTIMISSVLLLFPYNTSAKDKSYMDIPMPVDFVAAKQSDGGEMYITAQQLENRIRKVSPAFKTLYNNKTIMRYIVPQHQWFDQLLTSYKQFISFTGVKAKADTWDCENFSGMLNGIVTVRIWKAGYYDTRAAIGWIRASAKKSWAGIPGGVTHALIIAVTDKGVFIVEPQNGQYVSLEKYPNSKYIEEVYLF